MRKILLAISAMMILSSGLADAKTTKKTHKKQRHTSTKPTYYYNSDGTLSEGKPDDRRPSAYKGDKVPENDGVKKNQQRNLNYNSGQALPSSNGK